MIGVGTAGGHIDGGAKAMGLGMTLLMTHCFHKGNEEIEKAEAKAAENNVKNMMVENTKTHYEMIGSACLFFSTMAAVGTQQRPESFPNKPFEDVEANSVTCGFLSAGFALDGAASYIMRTDYLPPRKNCVRRGIDELSKLVKAYTVRPAKVGARV